MKKVILKAVFCLTLAASTGVLVTSCKTDRGTETTPVSIDPNDFRTTIKSGESVTLDATKTYKLTGIVSVEKGASLTIPAGTQIIATGGTQAYLLVDKGGKIFINGTKEKPVVFKGEKGLQGEWGGIVVLGYSPSNRSASGESTSELGERTYGGKVENDNSGSIQYLVIKDSGAKYSDEKEFNGLSLFGVGSGTKISHVFIDNGADDGIEFFGGTVNADHIISIGNGDDQFDWTEGWRGTGEYWYSKRNANLANAVEPGNRGIEADNQDKDPNATPISNPKVRNVTLIGNYAGSESQGIKLRAGTNGDISNVVLDGWNVGIDFETPRTFDWFKANPIKGVKFGSGVKKQWNAKDNADMSTSFTLDPNATGAGNGIAIPDWAKGWSGLN